MTSDLRAALDGVVEELAPEFELGAVCDWVAGGGGPDPEGPELEDGL